MKKYSSGIVSEAFWFVEFKKLVELRSKGKSWEEIKSMCKDENIFLISNVNRTMRMYGYLKTRIEAFNPDIFKIFLESDIATQKLINLIGIIKNNRLFFEFLYEVYREKISLGVLEIKDIDINIFLRNKQEQDELIASWTDSTVKRLGNIYTNFMIEVGLLSSTGETRRITPPILYSKLEEYLKKNGEFHIIKAITGVN